MINLSNEIISKTDNDFKSNKELNDTISNNNPTNELLKSDTSYINNNESTQIISASHLISSKNNDTCTIEKTFTDHSLLSSIQPSSVSNPLKNSSISFMKNDLKTETNHDGNPYSETFLDYTKQQGMDQPPDPLIFWNTVERSWFNEIDMKQLEVTAAVKTMEKFFSDLRKKYTTIPKHDRVKDYLNKCLDVDIEQKKKLQETSTNKELEPFEKNMILPYFK